MWSHGKQETLPRLSRDDFTVGLVHSGSREFGSVTNPELFKYHDLHDSPVQTRLSISTFHSGIHALFVRLKDPQVNIISPSGCKDQVIYPLLGCGAVVGCCYSE